MPSALINVSGNVFGLPEGSATLTLPPVSITTAVYERLLVDLGLGDNAVDIPTGATMVLLIPPSGNTVQVILKGTNGDTGISISRSVPFFYLLDGTSPPSSFVLNAASAIAGYIVVFA